MISLNQNRGNYKQDKLYFESLYLKYSKPLKHYVFRLTNNEELAEDLVQDCFLSFWDNRKKYRSIKNIQAYLYSIVKNKMLDHLKEEKAKAGKVSNFTTQTINQNTPQIQYEEKELSILKQEAINSLNGISKQVFIMSRDQALSYQEIAISLGVSKIAVKKQMMKALSIIRQKLNPYLDAELMLLFLLFLL
jgi:RNA polymerase sigma-70 factor (ECF subfamily)